MHALGLQPGAPACAVQSAWETSGLITAMSTTYLPSHLAAVLIPGHGSQADLAAILNPVPPCGPGRPAASPGALCLEVAPPPRWAARILRLRPGEPAITVTVRLDDPSTGAPVALTIATLHPARFRIAVETPGRPLGSAARTAEPPVMNPDPTREGALGTDDRLTGQS